MNQHSKYYSARSGQPTCRYAKALRNMPPKSHSTDEAKAFELKFDPTKSQVAKHLLAKASIGFNECFSVIPEAIRNRVIQYYSDINRYVGYEYTGPLPTTKEAGPARLLKAAAKKGPKRRKAKKKQPNRRKAKKKQPNRKQGKNKRNNRRH